MISKNYNRFLNNFEPFVIADLGCADGQNSIVTLKNIIGIVRDVNQSLPVVIYLTDTPFTDYNQAMRIVKNGLS